MLNFKENRRARRKTFGAGTRTNNKLNPHIVSKLVIGYLLTETRQISDCFPRLYFSANANCRYEVRRSLRQQSSSSILTFQKFFCSYHFFSVAIVITVRRQVFQ